MGNIDDSFLIGYNFTSCVENVVQAVCTFQSLEFVIHPTKARVALERILFIYVINLSIHDKKLLRPHIPKNDQFFCGVLQFHQSSKKPKCCLGGYPILAIEAILFIKALSCHSPIVVLVLKFRREISRAQWLGENSFFPDPSASFTYLYYRNGNYDNSFPVYVYGSYPENSDRFHWRYFGKEQQSQASRSSSPRSSITPIEEPSNGGSLTKLSESSKKKRKKYDTWSQAQKRLFVQLWAENH